MMSAIADRLSQPLVWGIAGIIVVVLVLIVVASILGTRRRARRKQAYLGSVRQRLPTAAPAPVHSDRLLPDRQSLEDAIQRQLAPSAFGSTVDTQPFSLIYLEVLDWRELVHGLGPQAAETLRTKITQRLQALLRPDDSLARIAPAGFAFLVRDAGLRAHQHLLTAIEPALAGPFSIDQHTLQLRCSMGASRYPDAGDSAKALLSVAMRLRHEFGTRGNAGLHARQA